ncbi:MAG: MBL fold metallo-hydrolase [Oscillospiraceae bacterium]|nr:MBL fold metallo-hydrolase [Oscillospiraceae bacterium]
MLKIYTLPLGDYQTNCYIVHEESSKTCAVIDPGYQAGTILKALDKLGLTLDAILLTHGHFDHVGAVQALVEATGCKLWMSESDWSQFPSPVIEHYFPLANCDFCEVQFCEDDEIIHAGGLTFHALATPGHTTGSMCFICENALFSGDTLFARSCGRTDLPGGDWDTIQCSLERLAELEGDYTVLPGHGEATTLERERRLNPYMR